MAYLLAGVGNHELWAGGIRRRLAVKGALRLFITCVVFNRNREFAPFSWRFHKENKNDMTKVAGLGLVLKGNGHLMYLLQIASCIRTESHNLPLILV